MIKSNLKVKARKQRFRFDERIFKKRKKAEEERTNLPPNVLRFLRENVEKRV